MTLFKRIVAAAVVLALVVVVGVVFGAWLSWNAPVDKVAETAQQGAGGVGQSGLAADVPEPPQPRTDGTRGVPLKPDPPGTVVATVTASGTLDPGQPDAPPLVVTNSVNPNVVIPDAPGTGSDVNGGPAAPASSLVPAALPPLPQHISDAGTATTVDATTVTAAGTPQMPTAAGSPPASEPWMLALRGELARCSAQSFLTRVVCNEQARWKYCNVDNRWGRIPECPQTGNN